MAQRHIQIFSNDPLLAPYLAHYLQAESWHMLEEDGKFYLCSSYIDTASTLSFASKGATHAAGLLAVLSLLEPEFASLSAAMKEKICIEGLLSIVNGILLIKYKSGLVRTQYHPPSIQEAGVDYTVDAGGRKVYTSTRTISVRAVITFGTSYFLAADRQQPSTKKLWNIARKDASVARAFYRYEKSEDVVELRKVIEEMMADTFTGKRTKTGKIPFGEWNRQKWTEPEVAFSTMQALWALLHNPLLLGEKALHSEAFADPAQANTFKALGPIMSLQEIREIVRTLLLKWLKSKS